MSRRARLSMFALAGPGLVAILVIATSRLPRFGRFRGVYGVLVNRIEPGLRRATDIVTSLNFDLRAFDTLGEEFILFGSVTGVALLLRVLRDEDEELDYAREPEEHGFAGASDALRVTSLVLVPLLVALGVYVVVHGQLTPGGGFQGGIVLAAGVAAVLLAGRYLALKRFAPDWVLEALDSSGAGAYALIGLGGLIFSGVFFRNFLPLGTPGTLLSAGTMPLSSVAVGLEVAGAFALTWTEFLDQALVVQRDG